MRILIVGNFGKGWDGSVCDEEHIANALEELGHEVVRWQRDDPNLNYGGTVPWFDTGEPDFTLIAQWDGYGKIRTRDFESSFIKELPRPLVYWAFDYQADGQEWHEELIKEADLYLSKRIADSKYSNWQWLAQDFAPKFLDKPLAIGEKNIDILFTGSYLPWATERNETLRAVAKEFNLVIHSVNKWPEEWGLDVRPPIMDKGLPELYASAKVILSIDHTVEAGYWSDRNAQIMACGRRPLFKYVPLSEARFGDRVDYFYSLKDGLEKIRSWEEKPTNAEGLYVDDRVKDLLIIVKNHLQKEVK